MSLEKTIIMGEMDQKKISIKRLTIIQLRQNRSIQMLKICLEFAMKMGMVIQKMKKKL